MKIVTLLNLSILSSALLFANSYKDHDPMKITNLKELKKLDKLAYELVEEDHVNTIETRKVFRYILDHKSYILGY